MTSNGKKLAVAALLVVGALGYLATAGISGGWVYFVSVDQLTAEHQSGAQRVRIHGRVSPDNLTLSPGTLTARFNLLGQSKSVPVDYRGAIPDLFKPGCDAVVEGRFDPATGTLRADVLLTKCASKYEENSPHTSSPKNGVQS